MRFLGRKVYAGLVVVLIYSDDAWPEARTGPAHSGSIEYQPQYLKALAPMVAGELRAQLFLESRASPIHDALCERRCLCHYG